MRTGSKFSLKLRDQTTRNSAEEHNRGVSPEISGNENATANADTADTARMPAIIQKIVNIGIMLLHWCLPIIYGVFPQSRENVISLWVAVVIAMANMSVLALFPTAYWSNPMRQTVRIIAFCLLWTFVGRFYLMYSLETMNINTAWNSTTVSVHIKSVVCKNNHPCETGRMISKLWTQWVSMDVFWQWLEQQCQHFDYTETMLKYADMADRVYDNRKWLEFVEQPQTAEWKAVNAFLYFSFVAFVSWICLQILSVGTRIFHISCTKICLWYCASAIIFSVGKGIYRDVHIESLSGQINIVDAVFLVPRYVHFRLSLSIANETNRILQNHQDDRTYHAVMLSCLLLSAGMVCWTKAKLLDSRIFHSKRIAHNCLWFNLLGPAGAHDLLDAYRLEEELQNAHNIAWDRRMVQNEQDMLQPWFWVPLACSCMIVLLSYCLQEKGKRVSAFAIMLTGVIFWVLIFLCHVNLRQDVFDKQSVLVQTFNFFGWLDSMQHVSVSVYNKTSLILIVVYLMAIVAITVFDCVVYTYNCLPGPLSWISSLVNSFRGNDKACKDQ
jgi:hypothetical protein